MQGNGSHRTNEVHEAAHWTAALARSATSSAETAAKDGQDGREKCGRVPERNWYVRSPGNATVANTAKCETIAGTEKTVGLAVVQ